MKKIFYRVKKNDTLSSIAREFKQSIFSIIKENMLSSDVDEGDMLILDLEQTTYTVLPLDTFESVSKKIGVSVEKLKELNNIPYLICGTQIRIN